MKTQENNGQFYRYLAFFSILLVLFCFFFVFLQYFRCVGLKKYKVVINFIYFAMIWGSSCYNVIMAGYTSHNGAKRGVCPGLGLVNKDILCPGQWET